MTPYYTITIPPHWQLLMSELQIANPAAAAFIISCFADYVSHFLIHQPASLLDPHFPDLRMRINLTLMNGGVPFAWTNMHQLCNNPSAGQADHSAVFVIRVLQYAAGTYAFQSAYELLHDEAILKEMHVILCKLQSIWIGTSHAWVEDERVREALKVALHRAMREA
ncbi:hypothetical protein B0T21DRAFT_415042 [Apiosordaria backusii]|uniref:Uncharacterized protein n=1 Tax=Apiosordaria backusii TaxID=314023 RepID=A0AA40ANE5_9PEZI|nr:hypothetical protein B0T21DRAFT_415042 [Apiosordaria backusii]